VRGVSRVEVSHFMSSHLNRNRSCENVYSFGNPFSAHYLSAQKPAGLLVSKQLDPYRSDPGLVRRRRAMLNDVGDILDALDFSFLLGDTCPRYLEVEDLENGGAYNAHLDVG